MALASIVNLSIAQDKKPKTAPVKSEVPDPNAPQKLSTQEIFSKGFQALQNQNPAEAADLFRAGLEINPNDGNAWLYLFKAQILLGDTDGAAFSKNKAIALGLSDTTFEPAKANKISLPWTGPKSFGGVSFPDEIRKKLEENPAYRLPNLPEVEAPDENLYFSYRETKDSTSFSQSVNALGNMINVIHYAKADIANDILTKYKTIINLDLHGKFFSPKIGDKFGIKAKFLSATHFEKRNIYGYQSEDKIILCEAIRSFSKADTTPAIDAAGTIYTCSTTTVLGDLMSTAQGALNSQKKLGTSIKFHYAHFPSKGLLKHYWEANLSELDSYK